MAEQFEFGRLLQRVQQAALESQEYKDLRYRLGYRIQDNWRRACRGEKLPGMAYSFKSERLAAALGPPLAVRGGVSLPILGDLSVNRLLEGIKHGHGPVDLKPGLLKNAKTSSSGVKYRVVPLTHSTEAESPSQSQSIPAKFSALLEANPRRSKRSGRAYQPQFQPRNKAERTPGGPASRQRPHMVYGRTVQRMPASNWRGNRIPAGASAQKFGHLSRLTGTPKTGLTTFRTVTSNSDANSWVLPPRPPNDIAAACIKAAIAEESLAG